MSPHAKKKIARRSLDHQIGILKFYICENISIAISAHFHSIFAQKTSRIDHLIQPLDVGVFGALKKQMAAEIEPLMRTGITRIQKIECLMAFVASHDKAVSVKNILSGFRGTGIHPFLSTKVLRRVASSPLLQGLRYSDFCQTIHTCKAYL